MKHSADIIVFVPTRNLLFIQNFLMFVLDFFPQVPPHPRFCGSQRKGGEDETTFVEKPNSKK
jgi:hypothetical protein